MSTKKYAIITVFQAYAHVKKECKDGFLGILWWVVDPIIYMAAFYAIFALGLRGRGPEFAPFLLCGLVPWKWFASSINRSTGSIRKNNHLMKQVYLPKVIFPVVEIIIATIKYIFACMALLLFLYFYSGSSVNVFLVFVVSLFQAFFILSLGVFLASLHPFLPDIKLIVENVVMFMFFVSGIFFDIDKFAPKVKAIFLLNPEAIIVKSFRVVFLSGEVPDFYRLMYTAIVSLCFLVPGLFVLSKFDRYYPKVV